MKRMNDLLKFTVCCVFLLNVSSVFSQASWDMTGPTVQKTVLVPTNEPNYPENLVERERTVIEDADGDIVFGVWREDNNEAVQNPSLVDGALEFYGLQTAYIENAVETFPNFERIAFDFNPSAIDQQVELVYFAYTFDIRIEPHASDGTSRLRAYLYCEDGTTANIKSSYTIQVGTWHSVESWIADGIWYLSLDGSVLDEQWNKGYAELTKPIKASVYPNLYLGSHPLGELRLYSGKLDNIELSFFEPECGDWGYLPTDFNQDCYVGIEDLAHFATTWLGCTDPVNEDCVQIQ
jgi:hypothetical protein